MTTAPKTTRPLAAADLLALSRLRLEGIRRFPDAFLVTEVEALATPEDALLGWVESGNVYGVFEADTLIGFAGLRGQTFAKARHRTHLGPFYVTPDSQGTNAADLLLGHLFEVARGRMASQMELYVAQANPRARAFYARHGFAATGQMPAAAIQNGTPHDDVFMVRDLSAAPLTPGPDGLRRLGPGDWRMFRDIRLEMLRDAPEGFDSTHADWGAKPADEVISWLRNTQMWAVVEGGRAVATAGWRRFAGSVVGHRGHVVAVYTTPKARRRGVARGLLSKVAQDAMGRGVTQLELDVGAENSPAIAAYEAAGYQITGTIPNCLNHSGIIQDQFHMVCPLTA